MPYVPLRRFNSAMKMSFQVFEPDMVLPYFLLMGVYVVEERGQSGNQSQSLLA
jgi:hypothetical protein